MDISLSCLCNVISTTLSYIPFAPKEQLFTNFNEKIAIDVINQPISYDEFLSNYMLKNVPCILNKWATNDWPATNKWSSKAGSPDFSSLNTSCKGAIVPVANCRSREFNAHVKQEMYFDEYVTYIESHSKEDDAMSLPCLYLKDWHFFREFPNEHVYTVPQYFSSDWLNELCMEHLPPFDDDFRFVYIGPKGSWTPFHVDVFQSYSWSANICGRKKWLLFPPGTEINMRDKNGHLAFDIANHPKLSNYVIEVIQEAGEVMFIPSGWHHQVHNLEVTISINHNWFNGCNLSYVWKFMKSELEDVENEIRDCFDSMTESEWIQQCQEIMKANTGLNLYGFYTILDHILHLRIKSLKQKFFITSKEPVVDFNIIPIIEMCRAILNRLQDLISIADVSRERSFTVPYEIVDICFLIPVLLDMCEYFQVKKLKDQMDFFQLLVKCYLSIYSYYAHIGEVFKKIL